MGVKSSANFGLCLDSKKCVTFSLSRGARRKLWHHCVRIGVYMNGTIYIFAYF
ncbi:hypothetical protein LguiA_021162 [Lonicera macranthoides]